MSANEKILKALKTAETNLESSVAALNKKDETAFADSVWHAADELEYALFLFSLTFQDEGARTKLKPNPELKKMDTHSLLAEAQNLLNEAERYLSNRKQRDSYKDAYVARHYVLRVQEDLAKKRREALKKK
jgi:hypothetical protein